MIKNFLKNDITKKVVLHDQFLLTFEIFFFFTMKQNKHQQLTIAFITIFCHQDHQSKPNINDLHVHKTDALLNLLPNSNLCLLALQRFK